MRVLTILAAAALVMMVAVAPSAPTFAQRARGQAGSGGHLHERRRADPSALLPELPSARVERADVAD